jgi:hypothetical protein
MLWNVYFSCPLRFRRARNRHQLIDIRLEEGLVRQMRGQGGKYLEV